MAQEPQRTFGGRYHPLKLLRQGQGVETFLGRDLAQGDDVVIKTAAASMLTATPLRRLEREAHILREVATGVLAPPRHVAGENGKVYVVAPFVPGMTLCARLSGGPLPVREALTVGLCLMEALRTTHSQGIFHLHIKPTDIIVDSATPLRQATLVDFGLARGRQMEAFLQSDALNTARYLSPEQAGALDHEVDQRSDLYAAGIVLFECLTGRLPFQGRTVGELLRQHVTAPVPSLRTLGRAVPRALDEIVQRLLRKDPQDRYQSAAAVQADLADLAGAWDGGAAEPQVVVGARDRRRTLTAPVFIGRTQELAALGAEFLLARQGHGRLVVVEGESGGGKTCLLEEFARTAARERARLLRGQGVALAAQRPFQVLDGVVSALRAAAQAERTLAERLQQGLGDNGARAAACTAMPQLSDILRPAPWDSLGPESYGEARSLAALSRLLDSLGAADRPTLVLLDDCQWADEQTLKLLGSWQQRRAREAGTDCHVLIVVAFRSEDVGAAHPLFNLQPSLHLRLSPFGTHEVRQIIQSMAGPVPDEAVDVVTRLSGGSPFMAVALLHGLVETGTLVAEPDSADLRPPQPVWRMQPHTLTEAQSSRLAAAFLTHRLDLLPVETLHLLSVGAVLGKTFDLTLAAALAGQTPEEAARASAEARQRHIIWPDAHGAAFAFLHDKLREALLARLQDEERRHLHQRAALCIERLDPERTFDLAFHFDAAGDSANALPYALAAAAAARARHALEHAEHYYRIAERGTCHADDDTRRRVAQECGEVLMLRGQYDEAADQFARARALAARDDVRAHIEGQLGELAFKRGDMKTATEALEQALRLLGKRVPRTPLQAAAALAWEVLVQALHSLLPGLFLARRALEHAEPDLLATHLYSRLGYAYWFRRGKVACLWAHLREMNLAERYPPTPQLAQAYSEHGPAMSVIPWFRRGIAYLERSLALRRAFGDLWGQGQTLHFYGVLLYAASRYTECIEKCRVAARLLEQTGDAWEADTAEYHIAFCHYRLGDFRAAAEASRRLHRHSQLLGNMQGLATSLGIWALATEGRVPHDLLQEELRRPRDDVQAIVSVLQAEALQLLGEGRPGDAAATLTRAHEAAQRTGMRNEYMVSTYAWLATAWRQEAERTSLTNPRRREQCLRRAHTALRRGLRLASRFQNSLPHALREAGLLAAARRRIRRARAHLDRSLDVARRQGARHEQAQTSLARGLAGLELGWPDAAQDLAQAHQMFHALGIDTVPRRRQDDLERSGPAKPPTLSLVDRFDAVLDTGRLLASALTRERIFTAVREATLTLLRADRSSVIEILAREDHVEIRTVAGETDAALNESVAGQVLAGQRPVILTLEAAQDSSAAAALRGGLTVLCAPILVRGRVIGGFYATAPCTEGLFGEHEVRLAEYIGVLAGAALENAEGFAELQRTHEELRQRVEEAALNVEISAAVLKSGELPTILQECAEILLRRIDAALVRVWTYQDPGGAFELQAEATRLSPGAHEPDQVPWDIQAIERIARGRRPYVTNRVALDPVVRSRTWAEREDLAAFAAYPLAVEDHVVGLMALFARQELSDATIRKLSLVAEPLSQCIIRKWAEQEIRTLNEQLERRVVTRTQELEAAKQALEQDLRQRERDERRLAAQHAVTRVLADSPTLTDAIPKILSGICESLEWKLGAFWQVDRYAGVIRCTDVWHRRHEGVAEFDALSRATTFPPGLGLPGRIWTLGHPQWIPDVMRDSNYPRAPAAALAGLRGAFGFPILIRTDVLGMIEFYSDAIQEPDEALLQMMAAIGSQIGQFIERKRAEEALWESEERYRTVAETAAEGIITIDETSTIVFVNRAAEQIFGYTPEEMLGQRLTLLMPEGMRGAHEHGMARYLATNQRHMTWERVHLPGRHKSGREIPLELAFWEFTQHGTRFFSSIVRDITERVQAAELRTRLLEQVISAQEEERRRIARELHDETGQALMSLLVGLHTIESAATLPEAQAQAEKFRRVAAQALDEVRRLAIGLRPSVLDDLGLAAALERYAAEYTQAYGITVDLHAPGLDHGRMPASVEITLYRILQEALTNIAKHAGASLVSLVVERHGGQVRAIVEDDGCGFDVDATLQLSRRTKHLGLHSMRERANLVNGTIAIESTPGRGTTIYVTIPLEEPRHEQD